MGVLAPELEAEGGGQFEEAIRHLQDRILERVLQMFAERGVVGHQISGGTIGGTVAQAGNADTVDNVHAAALERVANKSQPSGYASLDAGGHVPGEELPTTIPALTTHEAAADPHPQYQRESEKGQASGYASLDADGLVPQDQIPAGLAGISVQEQEGSPVEHVTTLEFATGTTVTDLGGGAVRVAPPEGGGGGPGTFDWDQILLAQVFGL